MYDLMLERTAIKVCCTFDECKLPYYLVPEDFYDKQHAEIFAAIQREYASKGNCSFVDLCVTFDAATLAGIMEHTYWPAPEEIVCKKLREMHILRVAKQFSITEGEAVGVISQFTEHADKLREMLPEKRRSTLDVFDDLFQKTPPSIPSGFMQLDDMVKMRAGNLVTIGARTRHGKTSFLINIACNLLQRAERVDFLTKEMMDYEILPRFIECITGMRFSVGKEKIDTELLSKLNIHNVQSVQDVATICASTDARLVIVDYIQILSSGRRSENRVTDLEYITGKLKDIAMNTGKCVVSASQINRGVDTAGRDPVLSDLRGSGSIEQDSNVVILLYNHAEESKVKGGIAQTARDFEKGDSVDVIVAKNRLGASGKITMKWDGAICKFTEINA